MTNEAQKKDAADVAFNDSILKEGVSKTAQDLAEAALDCALDEGMLKEIPMVSWIVRAYASVRGIQERLFLRKIALFLHEAGKISATEREAFSKRLADEPGVEESCGERALMLLDKLSEANKARLMGYAFRLFVQGKIDSVVLHRVYAALEMMPLWQLVDLPHYYFDAGLSAMGQGAAALFQQLWFIDIYYGDKAERLHATMGTGEPSVATYHQPFYRKTLMGVKVAELIRDYLAEPDELQ